MTDGEWLPGLCATPYPFVGFPPEDAEVEPYYTWGSVVYTSKCFRQWGEDLPRGCSAYFEADLAPPYWLREGMKRGWVTKERRMRIFHNHDGDNLVLLPLMGLEACRHVYWERRLVLDKTKPTVKTNVYMKMEEWWHAMNGGAVKPDHGVVFRAWLLLFLGSDYVHTVSLGSRPLSLRGSDPGPAVSQAAQGGTYVASAIVRNMFKRLQHVPIALVSTPNEVRVEVYWQYLRAAFLVFEGLREKDTPKKQGGIPEQNLKQIVATLWSLQYYAGVECDPTRFAWAPNDNPHLVGQQRQKLGFDYADALPFVQTVFMCASDIKAVFPRERLSTFILATSRQPAFSLAPRCLDVAVDYRVGLVGIRVLSSRLDALGAGEQYAVIPTTPGDYTLCFNPQDQSLQFQAASPPERGHCRVTRKGAVHLVV